MIWTIRNPISLSALSLKPVHSLIGKQADSGLSRRG
jgi:hypothetical protein